MGSQLNENSHVVKACRNPLLSKTERSVTNKLTVKQICKALVFYICIW